LPAFLERYPQVRVSLELTSRRVDILEEGVDVAVRIGSLPDSALLARRLGTSRSSLLASPVYLARHPPPRAPADLASHTAVDLQLGGDTGRRTWRMARAGDEAAEVEVEPRLLVNDPGVIRLAVLGGAGVGWLPIFLCADDLAAGRLVEVLPGWRRPGPDIHAVFPGQRGGAPSPAVRVFVDFLVAVVATAPPWGDPAVQVPPDAGP
jgi:DNA-binding transcriptional LysR family regulator